MNFVQNRTNHDRINQYKAKDEMSYLKNPRTLICTLSVYIYIRTTKKKHENTINPVTHQEQNHYDQCPNNVRHRDDENVLVQNFPLDKI